MRLEVVESIEVAHPFVKGFEKTYHCMSPDEVQAVARGEVTEQINKQTREDIENKEGGGTVHITSFFIGLEIQSKRGQSVFSFSYVSSPKCGFSWNRWTTEIGFIFSYVGIHKIG